MHPIAEATTGLKPSTRAVRVTFSFMAFSFCSENNLSTNIAKTIPAATLIGKNPPKNGFDMLCVVIKVKV